MNQEQDLNEDNIIYNDDYDYDYQDYYINEDPITENSNFNSKNLNSYFTLSVIEINKCNPSIEILKNEEIDKLRDFFINEAIEFTSLDKSDAILALIYFKWNLEKLKDSWFESDGDTSKYLELCGIKQINSELAKQDILGVENYNNSKSKQNENSQENNCTVCFSPSSNENPLSSLICNHQLCTSCWKDYLKIHVNMWNHRQALSTKCPGTNCNLILTENFIKNFLTQSPSILKSFQIIIRKNFIHFNPDIKYCPNTDCEIIIKCESKSNIEISCPNCNTNFCNKCQQEGHRPCQCEMVQNSEKKNLQEREILLKIIPSTKPCPKCRVFIEKSQGCDHMTCRYEASGCGLEFCWVCLKNWKGHKGCNSYAHVKTEEKKIKSSVDYQRYLHYFSRYKNHSEAMNLAYQLKEVIDGSIHDTNNFIESEFIFLEAGIESVIKSRRLLKFSYVFGYYLFEECKEKLLFEHVQSKLESNADQLHEFLEA